MDEWMNGWWMDNGLCTSFVINCKLNKVYNWVQLSREPPNSSLSSAVNSSSSRHIIWWLLEFPNLGSTNGTNGMEWISLIELGDAKVAQHKTLEEFGMSDCRNCISRVYKQTHWIDLKRLTEACQERMWITSWTLQVSSISMENSGWMESLSLVFTMCSSWISVVGKKSSANGSRKSSGFSPDRKTSSRAATTRLGSKDCHYVTSVPRGSWFGSKWLRLSGEFFNPKRPVPSTHITVAYSMCFGCYCLFMSVPIFDSSFSWPFSLPCFLQFQAQAKHPIRNI